MSTLLEATIKSNFVITTCISLLLIFVRVLEIKVFTNNTNLVLFRDTDLLATKLQEESLQCGEVPDLTLISTRLPARFGDSCW